MLDEAPVTPFGAVLDRAARRDRLRLWGFGALWVAGAVVLVLFLVNWSGRLAAMQKRLESLQSSAEEANVLNRTLRDAQRQVADSVRDVADEQRKQRLAADVLTDKLSKHGKLVREVAVGARQAQSTLERFRAELRGFEAAIPKVTSEVNAATDAVAAAQSQTAALEIRAREADLKFRNIERQLQTAHYVFKTNSENRVWGMDIFIRFDGLGKSRIWPGLDRLCVSATRGGQCLWGPEFRELGNPVTVVTDAHRYTITARYYVGQPILHDQVGFDVNRERIRTTGREDETKLP